VRDGLSEEVSRRVGREAMPTSEWWRKAAIGVTRFGSMVVMRCSFPGLYTVSPDCSLWSGSRGAVSFSSVVECEPVCISGWMFSSDVRTRPSC
jgi:hypothetical protein